jgi:hypothetical protein
MAHARQNIYKPGQTTTVPSDDPCFVLHIPDGFRCVFTYTAGNNGSLYRHLTVSVPGERYPSPEATVVIAQMFGFSKGLGAFEIPQSWQMGMHKDEHCIVVVEELK